MWTHQDFEICTWDDHPTSAAAQEEPECIFLLKDLIFASKPGILEIKRQLHDKIEEIRERRANGEEGIWMYLDSGASRSVIQEQLETKERGWKFHPPLSFSHNLLFVFHLICLIFCLETCLTSPLTNNTGSRVS